MFFEYHKQMLLLVDTVPDELNCACVKQMQHESKVKISGELCMFFTRSFLCAYLPFITYSVGYGCVNVQVPKESFEGGFIVWAGCTGGNARKFHLLSAFLFVGNRSMSARSQIISR